MPNDWEQKWPCLPVHVLITWCDEFIVFLDSDLDVDYKTQGVTDKKLQEAGTGRILNDIRVLEGIPLAHLSASTRISFRKMLGESLSRSLHGDDANASEILKRARAFIRQRNTEVSRRWIVLSTVATAAVCSLAFLIVWLYKQPIREKLGDDTPQMARAAWAGAVGTVFWVLTRSKKKPLDPLAGLLLHTIEGFSYVCIGMIGGFVVYLAMKSGLVVPQMASGNSALQVLLCMCGGASERLVPSLIRRVDETALPSEKPTNSEMQTD